MVLLCSSVDTFVIVDIIFLCYRAFNRSIAISLLELHTCDVIVLITDYVYFLAMNMNITELIKNSIIKFDQENCWCSSDRIIFGFCLLETSN